MANEYRYNVSSKQELEGLEKAIATLEKRFTVEAQTVEVHRGVLDVVIMGPVLSLRDEFAAKIKLENENPPIDARFMYAGPEMLKLTVSDGKDYYGYHIHLAKKD